MKRRIDQLLNGKFEYEQEPLEISVTQIHREVRSDEIVHGSFSLHSGGGRRIRGFLYTSGPRVICEPNIFQGTENEIRYQIDCSGLAPGDRENGQIIICSELGEYRIPYEVQVCEQPEKKSQMTARTLEEFTESASVDFAKAAHSFGTADFRRFLKNGYPDLLPFYDGLCPERDTKESLEEFLTGTGQKQPVQISVEKDGYQYDLLTAPVRETIRITRSGWGYQKLSVHSDAKFLRPEKRWITAEDYAGSSCDLGVVLDPGMMHAGKNYGRLRISDAHREICITFEAVRTKRTELEQQYHICKRMMKELESLYVSFRLKKTDRAHWIDQSVQVVGSYRRAGGRDPFAELFLVQLYFADGKKQKAYQILENLETQKERLDTPERYGFYLYMTTFFYREASYVDQVEAVVKKLYYQDRTNWKLLWILLYLQESYLTDEDARYEAVEEQFALGCRSEILYLEAYQILQKKPFLLRHLGSFEIQLLRFGIRENVLGEDLIRQMTALAMHHNEFDRQLLAILERAYEISPHADLVKAICQLLMRGQKKEPRYFRWYALGVEDGLRITGLYEYYLETMEQVDIHAMPHVIRMYFAYDTSMDYRRRAAIYRRIIENRETDIQTYHNYRAAMEKFALDQLEAGRISDDLAVIYRKFLRRSLLNAQNAEKLTRLLFTCEVTCSNPSMHRVIVHSARLRKEQQVALTDGKALIERYDTDSVVLVEDQSGMRYLADTFGTVRQMLDDEDMLIWCAEKACSYPGMILFFCAQCQKEGRMDEHTLPYFLAGCKAKEFSDAFRDGLRRDVLHYYMEHMRDDTLPDFLDGISYEEYAKVDKAALITLLAEAGRCKEAFELLEVCGSEGILLLQLVRICSRMVLELEFEENTMLVALCYSCFVSGKYDDKLLRYLLLYYEGPLPEMRQVWQAAVQFELDTMLLEEKILMLALFTRSGTQGTEQIFESYRKKMGRKKLCQAYVNLKAYEYFVKGLPVADPVFQYIERDYQYLSQQGRLDEQEEVCRLALLQYYANMVELNADQRSQAAALLEEFSARGMRFGFWRRFDRQLLAPYQMDGRVFVEYVCNPESRVTIQYQIKGRDEQMTTERVKNYFQGIFVREFTLFAGEELECHLEEEQNGRVIHMDDRVVKAPLDENGQGRYELLNQIAEAGSQGKEDRLQEELENYLMLEHLTETLFTLQ